MQTLTDSIIEPDETIIVSVAQSPNYKVGKISTAVITIQGATGDAAKPLLRCHRSATSITEGSPTSSLSARTGVAADGRAALQYSGTASEGTDYIRPGGKLVMRAGQTTLHVSIPTVQDNLVESDACLTVPVAASSTYQRRQPDGGTVTIESEDCPSCSSSAARCRARWRRARRSRSPPIRRR